MKGVIFNVVEEVVTEAISADAWDDVVEDAGVSGAYTSLGDYSDAELTALVGAIATAAGLTDTQTLQLAGRLGFKHLVSNAPQLLEGVSTWRDVLNTLDDIIHPEVRKLYPDAAVPGFASRADGAALLMTYTSARGLCALAEGLVRGCGEWFETPLAVDHLSCVHDGGDACTMRVTEIE